MTKTLHFASKCATANSEATVIVQWLHDASPASNGILQGISSCLTGDNPKQPSSPRHWYQYFSGDICACDQPNYYSRGRTAGFSVTSYPKQVDIYNCLFFINNVALTIFRKNNNCLLIQM